MGHIVAVGIAALVHQYLTLMALGLATATFIALAWAKQIRWYAVPILMFAVLSIALVLFYLIGNFTMPTTSQISYGYGLFSSNMNAFFNPQGHSTFLPTLPLLQSQQYEGYGYLGIGVMSVFIINALLFLLKKLGFIDAQRAIEIPSKTLPTLPIWLVCALFFIYALSNKIGWGNTIILSYTIYDHTLLGQVVSWFRGSGRFVRCLVYLISFSVLISFIKKPITARLKYITLSALCVVHFLDIQPLLVKGRPDDAPYVPTIPADTLSTLISEAKRVIMYPPYTWHYRDEYDYIHFAHQAALQGKPITTGYFARSNIKIKSAWENTFNTALDNGSLADETHSIFICRKDEIGRFEKVKSLLKCFSYNDYIILVPLTLNRTIQYLQTVPNCTIFDFATEGVSDFLARHQNHIILTAVMDDAVTKLSTESKQGFKNIGSHELEKLAISGAYIGVFYKKKCLFEQKDNDKMLEKSWQKGTQLGDLLIKKDIHINSKGTFNGMSCAINVGGIQRAIKLRGINFVVLDDNFEVIETVRFDTYTTNKRVVFL